ncbi:MULTISPECIES: HD domain-containing protein [unclassified Desulfovibrio]|uniref:HD domain-containing protein n=1 Tax=unclassified Desulfovibrio TaxID=2593640 RepID=UPI000F5F4A87|nr:MULTISPECIES: HD domain-containing protein [unclassified Desulfovibrio]RRD70710.1 HD domain-containing protein [Desulfovibrio sp. OH1209_COT-279]RRD87112.1 HD domain-containing protein [Desulfovibrio sp. OH1186_COT-070]
MDIAVHQQWLQDYFARQRASAARDPGPLDLKMEHSLLVFANAARMVEAENFSPLVGRSCLLAALYHDVGRFEQYLRYGTFRDRDSCNHGHLGVRILKREGALAKEPPDVARLVLAGVGLHNRFSLPVHMPRQTALVVTVVRDADKLDILRVMDCHLRGPEPYHPAVVLQLPDDPGLASPKVRQAVLERRSAAYADLLCVNDFRLLLGSWYFDLHFSSSRRQFLRDGHAASLLQGLRDCPPHADVRDALLRELRAAAETA